MVGPMEGIRVVELGAWVAAASAAGNLADWGASVIKVEPHSGDPFRWIYTSDRAPDPQMPPHAAFGLDNRNKRSIVVDIHTSRGRQIITDLISEADVFVTNMRVSALDRYGFDYESLVVINPQLIYGMVTAYGREGPDKDRASYDVGAFWSRSGIAWSLADPGSMPPFQRSAMGDHATGAALAGGIAAALFQRTRTGQGQLVSTSLLRMGMYVLGWDTSTALDTGLPTPVGGDRTRSRNPAFMCYNDRDGHWFWLLGLEGDRHWPAIARAVGRTEWLHDDRYSSFVRRAQHASDLVKELDQVFAEQPLSFWGEAFDREGVWWAPIQSISEALLDPQVEASGAFVYVEDRDESTKALASPIDFGQEDKPPYGPSAELGQHTEEILLELGYTWHDISELKSETVINSSRDCCSPPLEAASA